MDRWKKMRSWIYRYLSIISFKGANLYEANLLGANISGAIFDEANLSNAIWIDGKKCALGSIGSCQ